MIWIRDVQLANTQEACGPQFPLLRHSGVSLYSPKYVLKDFHLFLKKDREYFLEKKTLPKMLHKIPRIFETDITRRLIINLEKTWN